MTLIHGYLLRQFIRVFLIFFLSFTGLYIVIDAFSNIDHLIAYGEMRGSVAGALFHYYSPRVLYFFDRAGGMLILISAMFTISAFQRHNELTALLAAGIPEKKIVKPLIAAAVCLSLLAAVNRELGLPAVRQSLSQDARMLTSEQASQLDPIYDNQTDILLSGSGAVIKERTILKPNFYLPKALAVYGNELRAERAVYEPPLADRPGGYRLIEVADPALRGKPSLGYEDRLVIFTPLDTPWLEPHELFVASKLDFEQLTGGGAWRQFSSTYELISAANNPSLDHGANVRVAIHARFVQPFLDMTLLFLGLPLVLVPQANRHKLVALGKGALLLLVFTGWVMACQYLGNSALIRPALAAWLPLMLFVPAAVWMYEPFRDPGPSPAATQAGTRKRGAGR